MSLRVNPGFAEPRSRRHFIQDQEGVPIPIQIGSFRWGFAGMENTTVLVLVFFFFAFVVLQSTN